MQQRGHDVAAMWREIDALDFERIKEKLLQRHHGKMTAQAGHEPKRAIGSF